MNFCWWCLCLANARNLCNNNLNWLQKLAFFKNTIIIFWQICLEGIFFHLMSKFQNIETVYFCVFFLYWLSFVQQKSFKWKKQYMYTLLGTAFHLQLSKIFKPTLMEKKYLINPISNHLVPPHHNPNQNINRLLKLLVGFFGHYSMKSFFKQASYLRKL